MAIKKTTTKKKLTKEQLTKKLTKENKIMWSKIGRAKNNGLCCLCNKNKAQNTHHWFVNAARSLPLRFKELNGLPLCYGCHIHVIHKDASVFNAIELLNIATRIFKMQKDKLLSKLYFLYANEGHEYNFDDLVKDNKVLKERMKELGL